MRYICALAVASLLAASTSVHANAAFLQQTSAKVTILNGLSQGLQPESLAASGLSPSEVQIVLGLLQSHSMRLSELCSAYEQYQLALQRLHAAEQSVHRLGQSSVLSSELDEATSEVSQTSDSLDSIRNGFAMELSVSLEDVLDTQTRTFLINSVMNSSQDVPAYMRIIPSDSVDWLTLQAAARTVRSEGVSALTPEQAAVWSAVRQRPDVIAAEQMQRGNASAIATAFAVYFSGLSD